MTSNVSCFDIVRQRAEALYEEVRREMDHENAQLEDNALEMTTADSTYFEIKKQNMLDIFTVYTSMIKEENIFRCNFMRLNHLRQFQAMLPIYSKKREFITMYNQKSVIIVKSSAGSGKSTQLPQYMLDSAKGRILVTQPRVIAADSVAKRVASELYQVGFVRSVVGSVAGPHYNLRPSDCQILYMTEHEFVSQVVLDRERFLSSFEAFLIDEAHELRKTTLIILAILKRFMLANPGKHKLIITSATLDTEVFMKGFEALSPGLIEAKVPTYSVTDYHTFFPDLDSTLTDNTLAHLKLIFEHIKKNHQTTNMTLPNVLVFLPSIKEIMSVKEAIEADPTQEFKAIKTEVEFVVEELHGGLKPAEKKKVMNPSFETKRMVRVILATKIAETAITLEDVYYVLDSGKETQYYFDESRQMDYNKIQPISKSSAIQRRGRAGRLGPGFCFKMYKQEEEMEFELTSTPEIVRMDIADVILTQIELSSLFDFSDLLFYDKMDSDKINNVTQELKRIEALKDENELTQLTNKGRFIIGSNLKTMIAAFLYETIRFNVKDLGFMATTALNSRSGQFKTVASFQ